MASEADVHAMERILLAIRTERVRQITQEGWSPEHDDGHRRGQLASAAICYTINAAVEAALLAEGVPPVVIEAEAQAASLPPMWPWARGWWKPKDRKRNLIRAAALIVAELQRIEREEARRG